MKKVPAAAPLALALPPLARRSQQPIGTPTVRPVAVAGQPVRFSPGGEVALVITYGVAGVPSGGGSEALERREIYYVNRRLTSLDEHLMRSNHTFTSVHPLRVPIDLLPGICSLRAAVVMAGGEVYGGALFEVSAQGGWAEP